MSEHRHEPVSNNPPPASPVETAVLFDAMRAILATVLAGRKDYRLRCTERQRARVGGVLVRVAMTTDGTIEAWLEAPVEGMRHGVPYLGPHHPIPERSGE